MTLIGDSAPERTLSAAEAEKWWILSEIALDHLQALFMSALDGTTPEEIYINGYRHCQYMAAWREADAKYEKYRELATSSQD